MKKRLKCKMTVLLLNMWIAFSLIGFFGRDTIYSRYQIDVKKTPYFVLVLRGVRDGIYPWSNVASDSGEEEKKQEENEIVSETETLDGTETVEDITEEMTEQQEVSEPAPKEFVTVGEDYFSDAVFIGDSRTVGLFDYGGLDDATFYATVGLNVYDMWDEEFCEIDGKKVTLEEALTTQKFGKVYFQIGINEMGRGTVDSFMKAYSESVEKFHELQPDATIFVQGIMKVAKEKSDKDPIFNNPGIEERNGRIAALANGTYIFYIDVNEVVCDAQGCLNSDLTFDNIHLYGSKYDIWVNFLLEHGIE